MKLHDIRDAMKSGKSFNVHVTYENEPEIDWRKFESTLTDLLLEYHPELNDYILESARQHFVNRDMEAYIKAVLLLGQTREQYIMKHLSVRILPHVQSDKNKRIAKVIRKVAHDKFAVPFRYKYSPKMMQDITEALRNTRNVPSVTDHYTLLFEPFDEANGSEYYYNSGSCVWGSYSTTRCILHSNNAYAILTYDTEDRLCGRAFAFVTDHGFAYGNEYHDRDVDGIAILYDWIESKYGTELCDKKLYLDYDSDVDGNTLDDSYYYVSLKSDPDPVPLTLTTAVTYIPDDCVLCDDCGCLTDYENLCCTVDDRYVCEGCAESAYTRCEHCNLFAHDTDIIEYRYKGAGWVCCPDCTHVHDVDPCYACEEYFPIEDLYADTDGDLHCEDCRDRHPDRFEFEED